MLNLASILLFSENPQKLADFYKKVFEKDADWHDNNYFGFMVGKCFLSIGPHDKVKGKNKTPERVMFNFESNDVEAEFARIEKLGAKVIAKPYKMGEDMPGWIATFADPDGNYFQLVPPWEDMRN